LTAVTIPYGRAFATFDIPAGRLKGVLQTRLAEHRPPLGQTETVRESLERPVAGPRLADLAREARRVLVITSDHTRPLPSRLTLPLLLAEARKGNPAAEVTILVATGCHRATTRAELVAKFGEDLVATENFVVHDSQDTSSLVCLGRLPSGSALWVNSLVRWADLVVAEGLLEPHTMAGYSGGRKSILPGIAGERSVLAAHWTGYIAHPNARSGNFDGNPIHADMVVAAKAARLSFILNVVINSRKEIVASFSGQPETAHKAGCEWLDGFCRVTPAPADIVVSTNGGYPLDQNIYQCGKGILAAAATCKPGGVIVMVAACEDGHGSEPFYNWFRGTSGPEEILRRLEATPKERTLVDQWGAQMIVQVQVKHRIVFVTDQCPRELVETLHMTYASTIHEGLDKAEAMVGRDASVTVIPDGVSVVVDQASAAIG
jgi:nickel-dependent lactate racemase